MQDQTPLYKSADVLCVVGAMNAIFGLCGYGSLRRVAPQLLWESRLRANLDGCGSPEYKLTWKHLDMWYGEPLYLLRASVARRADTASGGWHTPRANDPEKRGNISSDPRNGLPGQVKNAVGWTTPTADDKTQRASPYAQGGTPLTYQAGTAKGWGTPRNSDGTLRGQKTLPPSGTRARLELEVLTTSKGWVTPSSRDWKDTPGMSTTGTNPDGSKRVRLDLLPRQVHQVVMRSGNLQNGSGVMKEMQAKVSFQGVLNPEHSRWLMGLPKGWLD